MDTLEPRETKEVVDAPAQSEHVGSSTDTLDLKLSGYFNIPYPTGSEKQILAEMKQIFGGGDETEVLWNIKNVENRVGNPPVGTSRLQHVYNFAKLNSQIGELEKQRDIYVT